MVLAHFICVFIYIFICLHHLVNCSYMVSHAFELHPPYVPPVSFIAQLCYPPISTALIVNPLHRLCVLLTWGKWGSILDDWFYNCLSVSDAFSKEFLHDRSFMSYLSLLFFSSSNISSFFYFVSFSHMLLNSFLSFLWKIILSNQLHHTHTHEHKKIREAARGC